MNKPEWVDTNAALEDLCEHLRTQPFFAVDTEFHHERHFFAKLALVQVASQHRVACIDPLAVELDPFDAVLADQRVTKVMHAGKQDLTIFFDRTGVVPSPIFDTQVAASLVGRGDQIAYASLVKQLTGKQLRKLHGLTDWLRRPLGDDVLAYATADVTFLLEIYPQLEDELTRLGRRGWLDEEQAHLLSSETYIVHDRDAWKRIKGAGRLRGVECAVAQALAGWREQRARKLDRPRRHMLPDRVVIDLARSRPRTLEGLSSLRALDAGTRKRHGKALLQRIEAATRSPEDAWPERLSGGPRGNGDAALVDALSAVLQHLAQREDISPRLLATRRQLDQLAAGETDLPILRGWRAELVGSELRAFLEGRRRIEVDDGEFHLVSSE